MAKKKLLLSELSPQTYDGGKSAKRAFLLLVLFSCFLAVPRLAMILIEPFTLLLMGKISLIITVFVLIALAKIYVAQKKMRWLDYGSATALFARVKKDAQLCLAVNDLAPLAIGQTASPDETSDGLTPAERTMRKATLRQLRYSMLNTDSKLKWGIVWYLGGALFVAVLPEVVASGSTLKLVLLCGGYIASLYGMIISFIAWYTHL
jgi:hypothetical protein